MGVGEETGVSHVSRDARIAPIYEGTNGIQAMDLVGRKLPMRMGGVINEFTDQIRALDAELASAGDEFATIRSNLATYVETLAEATAWIFEHGLANPVEALSGATPYLGIFGTVLGGYFTAQLALAAHRELESGNDDVDYLKAKITNARFYAEQLLPRAGSLLPAVTAGSGDLYAVTAESLASI